MSLGFLGLGKIGRIGSGGGGSFLKTILDVFNTIPELISSNWFFLDKTSYLNHLKIEKSGTIKFISFYSVSSNAVISYDTVFDLIIKNNGGFTSSSIIGNVNTSTGLPVSGSRIAIVFPTTNYIRIIVGTTAITTTILADLNTFYRIIYHRGKLWVLDEYDERSVDFIIKNVTPSATNTGTVIESASIFRIHYVQANVKSISLYNYDLTTLSVLAKYYPSNKYINTTIYDGSGNGNNLSIPTMDANIYTFGGTPSNFTKGCNVYQKISDLTYLNIVGDEINYAISGYEKRFYSKYFNKATSTKLIPPSTKDIIPFFSLEHRTNGFTYAELEAMSFPNLILSKTENEIIRMRIVNPYDIIFSWGDSMSDNTYESYLQNLISYFVKSRGKGGQNAQQICARQGSTPIYISTTGNIIPASGGVAISYKNTNILYNGGVYTGTATGTILGVTGIMTTDSSGNWTFTRDESGEEISCPENSLFEITIEGDYCINIFWMGRNGYQNSESIMSYLAGAVAFLKGKKRFIVMTVTNGSADDERNTGVNYHYFIELNNLIKATYPNNFFDVREMLIENYNPLIPQDVIDFNTDTTPSSLRTDAIHLNAAGNTLLSTKLFDFIKLKGWLNI